MYERAAPRAAGTEAQGAATHARTAPRAAGAAAQGTVTHERAAPRAAGTAAQGAATTAAGQARVGRRASTTPGAKTTGGAQRSPNTTAGRHGATHEGGGRRRKASAAARDQHRPAPWLPGGSYDQTATHSQSEHPTPPCVSPCCLCSRSRSTKDKRRAHIRDFRRRYPRLGRSYGDPCPHPNLPRSRVSQGSSTVNREDRKSDLPRSRVSHGPGPPVNPENHGIQPTYSCGRRGPNLHHHHENRGLCLRRSLRSQGPSLQHDHVNHGLCLPRSRGSHGQHNPRGLGRMNAPPTLPPRSRRGKGGGKNSIHCSRDNPQRQLGQTP